MNGHSPSRATRTGGALAASLALAVGLVVALPGQRLAAHPGSLTASFDWRVPDRFGPNGMIGVGLPVTESAATMRILNPEGTFGDAPAGWPVDFDACSSQGSIVKYIWAFSNSHVTQSSTCGPTRIVFPREGRYRMMLTVVDAFGGRVTTWQDVNIQDWLIFGLGDSYGSGEGIPNTTADLDDVASLAVQNALNALRWAQGRVEIAQGRVDSVRQAVANAVADYEEAVAAANAFAAMAAELADSQAALSAATAELTASTANLAEAEARVLFECAQWWDPEGCAWAQGLLTAAHQRQGRALNARAAAAARRNTALANAASMAAALGAESFEYALNIVQAAVSSTLAQLQAVQQELTAALADLAQAIAEKDGLTPPFLHAIEGLATWQDTRVLPDGTRYSQCHQSKQSGQAQAALRMEQADPKTSVTFIHLACTGATIAEGILGDYAGVTPTPDGINPREPQLATAKRMAGGREVDALITSIGGNDIGFATILEGCIALDDCSSPTANGAVISDATIASTCAGLTPQGLAMSAISEVSCRLYLERARDRVPAAGLPAWLDANLDLLPQRYLQLKTAIDASWPGLPADRMFLTQYPIVTRDQYSMLCGQSGDPTRELPGITPSEYAWAEAAAGQRLNDVVAGQQGALGWTPVAGIDEAFRAHGYCSTDTWMVRIQDSFMTQATYWGIAHPTVNGQAAYATQIVDALRRAFYPGSTPTTLGPARADGR